MQEHRIKALPVIDRGHHKLARLLTERGIHQVPVIDGRNKLAGMITQTDLIAALYRSMTTHRDKAA